jgi:hypothetical protein
MTHAAVSTVAASLFAVLTVLATLEMSRRAPRPMWTIAALLTLAAAAAAVAQRERRPPGK